MPTASNSCEIATFTIIFLLYLQILITFAHGLRCNPRHFAIKERYAYSCYLKT